MRVGPDARLEPVAELEVADGGGWLATGCRPTFRILTGNGAPGPGWYELAFRVDGDPDIMAPILEAVAGSDQRRHALPLVEDQRGGARWFGPLPDDCRALLLEPVLAPGHFQIGRLSIRRISRPELVLRTATKDPLLTLRAVFWRALGKKVRARAMLESIVRAYAAPSALSYNSGSYQRWIRAFDTPSDEEAKALRDAIAAMPDPPTISVLMPVYNPKPENLEAAIQSIRDQSYTLWELSIADDASTDPRIAPLLARLAATDGRIKVARRETNGHISAASNTALDSVTGAYTALMDHDDLLPPHALAVVAREIVHHPEADLIYSDEDKIDDRGRRYMPHFKSDWNEELFFSQNYINHLGIYRTDILRRIGGFRVGLEGSQDHDLVLRFLDHTDESRIRHIPRILYHWRNYESSASFSTKSKDKAIAARRRALVDHVARRGWRATVADGAIGTNRLVRALPDPPPEVAVIIPTRDRAKLLRVAARGVLKDTDYPRLRLVIVDNGSAEPETLALFDELRTDPRVSILPVPGPFNFSRLNNLAVATVDSDVLCLLNNDIEVTDEGWLREMVSSLTPGVAAAGARLLYPDGTVQHAGVVLGAGGVAGHAQMDISKEDPGYFGRAVLPQYMSAVTGACLVVRREAYLEVGGLDEEHLHVAFNDIDFCLKLRARGHKIVYAAYAELTHHESASRGLEDSPEKKARFSREIQVMLDRWGPALRRDPYYNLNFALDFADFKLKGLSAVSRKRPQRHATES